jgi:hypothetical protein
MVFVHCGMLMQTRLKTAVFLWDRWIKEIQMKHPPEHACNNFGRVPLHEQRTGGRVRLCCQRKIHFTLNIVHNLIGWLGAQVDLSEFNVGYDTALTVMII